MGKCSSVPVVNGCCDREHPTQALADCMTIKELFGTYKKSLLYVGIWNNTFNSLLELFPPLGGRLLAFCPIVNVASATEAEIDLKKGSVPNFEHYGPDSMSRTKLSKLAAEADIIYVDTWVDMEFFSNPAYAAEKERRISIMKPYTLDAELLRGCGAKVMHDMPMHEGREISREAIEANIDTILTQAENRRHVAKGIFLKLLGTGQGKAKGGRK
jgi:ornithine carbamoyltransferase